MKKVVYNGDFGGFGLSVDALYLLLVMGFPLEASSFSESGYTLEDFPLVAPDGVRAHQTYPVIMKGDAIYHFNDYTRAHPQAALRSHPLLVHVVEKLGKRAGSGSACLQIAELNDDDVYRIEEYDGSERVRVLDKGDYVAGFTMTELAIPDVNWAQPLLTSNDSE